MKDLILVILDGSCPIIWWFNATVNMNWKHLPSLFLGFIVVFPFLSIWRNYAWSALIQTYLMVLHQQSIKIIKHKSSTLHWLFSTYLMPMLKEIKKSPLISSVPKSNMTCLLLLLGCIRSFSPPIFWRHESNIHCQINFLFASYFKIITSYHLFWKIITLLVFHTFAFIPDIFIIKDIWHLFFGLQS